MCSMPDLFFIEFVFVQYEVQKHTCLKGSSCICMYFIVRQSNFKKNKGKFAVLGIENIKPFLV